MKLRLLGPKGETREVDLATQAVTIGREYDNTIVFSERTVSRHHCSFLLSEHGEAVVEDTVSRYGTFLNGRPISESKVIIPGDMVRFGDWSAEIFDDTLVAEDEVRELSEDTPAEPIDVPEEQRETTKTRVFPQQAQQTVGRKGSSHQVLLTLLAVAGFGGLLVFIYLLMNLHA